MRALFLDWGGTLALTKDNRTVIDAEGRPVLMPNVAATLARERRHFGGCFIVSDQARVSRGEISEAEVLRRFAWTNEQLGRPFSDCRLCPHTDGEAANAASLVRGCSSSWLAATM
jgi:histidinol phosphatase-like enzyme